jgi:hypothetical protein
MSTWKPEEYAAKEAKLRQLVQLQDADGELSILLQQNFASAIRTSHTMHTANWPLALNDSQQTGDFYKRALQLFKDDADKALLVVCNLNKIAVDAALKGKTADEEWEPLFNALRKLQLDITKESVSGRTADLALTLGPQGSSTYTVPPMKNVLFQYKKEEMLALVNPMQFFRQNAGKDVAHKECETKERLKALLGRMSEKAGPLKLPQRIAALKSRLNDPPTMKTWIEYHVETLEEFCRGLVIVPENLQKMKALTRLALAAHLWDNPTQVNDFIHAWVYKRSAEAVKLVWKDAEAFQDSSTSRAQASYVSLEGQVTNVAWDDAIVKCLEDVPIQGITELVEEVDLPVVSQKRPAQEFAGPSKPQKAAKLNKQTDTAVKTKPGLDIPIEGSPDRSISDEQLLRDFNTWSR